MAPRIKAGTLCKDCGVKPVRKSGNKSVTGEPLYISRCRRCARARWPENKAKGYKKGPVCKTCGFTAKHACQLDIDHIDGNHKNNDPENLQTLCSNCHRLKTWTNKDWQSSK